MPVSAFERIRIPLCFTGASFLYAWSFLVESSPSAESGRYSVMGVLIPLLFVFFWRRISDGMEKQWLPIAFAVLGSVGTYLEMNPGVFETGGVIGTEMRTASLAALLLLWCAFYARLPLVKAAVSFASMQVLSLAFFLLLRVLPDELYGGMALLLPLFSTSLFILSNEKIGRYVNRPHNPPAVDPSISFHMRWRLLCIAFMCAFAYGIGRVGAVPDVNIASYGLSGIVLLLIATLLVNRFSVYSVFNVAFPLVLLGIIALAVELGSSSQDYSKALLNMGYALSTGAFTLLIADKSYRFGVPALWAAGVLRAVLAVGVFVGANAEGVLGAFFHGEIQSSQFAYGIALFFVAVAAVIWLQDKKVEEGEEAKGAADSGREDCAETPQDASQKPCLSAQPPDIDVFKRELVRRSRHLASEYRLSKREAEVLDYLAFGWSVSRIESELCISNSTVKTHVKHIYAKLGIHSRDELKILLGVDTMLEGDSANRVSPA